MDDKAAQKKAAAKLTPEGDKVKRYTGVKESQPVVQRDGGTKGKSWRKK